MLWVASHCFLSELDPVFLRAGAAIVFSLETSVSSVLEGLSQSFKAAFHLFLSKESLSAYNKGEVSFVISSSLLISLFPLVDSYSKSPKNKKWRFQRCGQAYPWFTDLKWWFSCEVQSSVWVYAQEILLSALNMLWSSYSHIWDSENYYGLTHIYGHFLKGFWSYQTNL